MTARQMSGHHYYADQDGWVCKENSSNW